MATTSAGREAGSASPCAVCGSTALERHLGVAGEAGDPGLVPTTTRFGTALADIARCRGCGHMQLEHLPDEAGLLDAYARAESTDYVVEEEGQRRTAGWTLDLIERHVAPGRLIDLGCWVGFLLAEARARGWTVVGVEPSEFGSRFARERLGLDVRTGPIDELPEPGEPFQAAVMADVLEHLPDPGRALRQVRSLLAADGVLALALPDAGSRLARVLGRRWWSVIPTHVHYFTRESVRALLGREGFEVAVVRTAPKAFSVRYYLERIGGYSPALSRGLVGAARRIGLAERLWAPDFRDRMLVIARRT